MFVLNPEAPPFVPAPQLYPEYEYEETKDDGNDGNDDRDDRVEYDYDDEDYYVGSDGQMVLIENLGEWFRVEGGGYYHVFENEVDDNNGYFYPQPIRRSLTWMNSRK